MSTTTLSRQRTISSYIPPAPDNYSSIRDRIVETCVEFCALDGKPFDTVTGDGFINLAKQLMNAGALIGTGFSINDILPHATTVSMNSLSNLSVFFFYRSHAMSIEFISDLKIN